MSESTSKKAKFKEDTTKALTLFHRLPDGSLVITKIKFVAGTKRHLLAVADSVLVDYTITTKNVDIETFVADSSSNEVFLTTTLVDLGYIGATATVSPLVVDRSPTSAPIRQFVTSRDCFAGTETVSMESGERRSISEIRVGDRVLASTTTGTMLYSEVRSALSLYS